MKKTILGIALCVFLIQSSAQSNSESLSSNSKSVTSSITSEISSLQLEGANGNNLYFCSSVFSGNSVILDVIGASSVLYYEWELKTFPGNISVQTGGFGAGSNPIKGAIDFSASPGLYSLFVRPVTSSGPGAWFGVIVEYKNCEEPLGK